MIKRIFTVVCVFTVLLVSSLEAVAATPTPRIVFSEIKLGGVVAGQPTEFIELFNDSDVAVDLSGWLIEYAKPAAVLPDCSVESWKVVDGSSNVLETSLSGMVEPRGRVIVTRSLNDGVGGSLRLQHTGVVSDLVGWGSDSSSAPCNEGVSTATPPNPKSLKRKFDLDGHPQDTNNNMNDFSMSDIPSPELDPPAEAEQTDVCPNITDIQASLPNGYELIGGECLQVQTCDGIELSEIVPNPSGDDTNNEYVELYNPTNAVVDLNGCELIVGSSSKQLSGQFEPGYQAFYGLTLPNSAGGEVTLNTVSTESTVIYPAGLGDGESWSFINGDWQLSNVATPSTLNQVSIVAGKGAEIQESCDEGKFRNPETGRCKNIETVASLTPCDAGEYRNTETNRCRKATVASVLSACAAGEFRNSETNRCRKLASAAASAAPCKEGYERNNLTNRCRKVIAPKTTNPLTQTASASSKAVSFPVIMIVAVSTLGYGVYEYRKDIVNWIHKLRKNSTV